MVSALVAVVDEADTDQRLDVWLAGRLVNLSRSRARDLILEGAVTLNGAPAKPSTKVHAGDLIGLPVEAPAPSPPALEPEDIPLNVVYEDEDVIVLDKPAGLVVHPSAGHSTGTLVHALLARYPELRAQGGERPGIVHRLDKDTSGLMLVARNAASLRYLQDELRERRVLKEYLALCCGRLDPPSARIEAPIGRHPRNPLKMAVVSTGREALTEYRTLAISTMHSLALVRLHTGRTHQIRVHLAATGHPLAGDATYGHCAAPELDRQFLHSCRLALTLPRGEHTEWHSQPPADLQRTLALLGLEIPAL